MMQLLTCIIRVLARLHLLFVDMFHQSRRNGETSSEVDAPNSLHRIALATLSLVKPDLDCRCCDAIDGMILRAPENRTAEFMLRLQD